MSAGMRKHFLGGRTVAQTTPWASAYMTAEVVTEIAGLGLPTVEIYAAGPRGPFHAFGPGKVNQAWGRTVIAAVRGLV